MAIEDLRKKMGQINHRPTEGQKHGGNYKKGHVRWKGLQISIENARGSVRQGISHEGKKWRSTLPAHYGYILGSVGNDGDHVDCYLGPDMESNRVFVIDQRHHKPGHSTHGEYDEAKVMIGFPDIDSAKKTYRAAFTDNHDRILYATQMTVTKFKEWLREHDTTKPVAYFRKSQ